MGKLKRFKKWVGEKVAESRARPRPRTAKRIKEMEERKEHKRKLKLAHEEGKRARLKKEREREIELARKGVKPKRGWWQTAKKAYGKFERYSAGVAKNIDEGLAKDFGGEPTRKTRQPDLLFGDSGKRAGISDPLGLYSKPRRKKRKKKKRGR